MDEKIANAGKNVLADIVKLIQKLGMKGDTGGWKEFLAVHDRKFGASMSDPSKRTADVLGAFLKTFSKEEDLKFLAKIFQSHENREVIEKQKKKSPDSDSPEQRLVRLTLEHPRYSFDYNFPSHEEEWVITKLVKKSKSMRSTNMVAVHCETVLCEDGTDSLVRLCVLDGNFTIKLNELVKPSKAVADYRTAITGLSADDLSEITCSLVDVQKSMKKILSDGTIMIGHGLYKNLKALKLEHARVIDTSFIFSYPNDPNCRRPSLNDVCKSVLGHNDEVRKTGAPRNCVNEASAVMKLVHAKLEHGIDTVIPLICEEDPEMEMTKLLLHMIPLSVPSEELTKIFSGDYTIERQPVKKAGGKTFSALAIFKSLDEADLAYKKVKGNQEKDTAGRPQKLVTFELSTGQSATLYVRKMAGNDPSFKKRPIEESAAEARKVQKKDEVVEHEKKKVSKKVVLKKNQVVEDEKKVADFHPCRAHEDDIQKLNGELKKREVEISYLHGLMATLTRKQGVVPNIPLSLP